MFQVREAWDFVNLRWLDTYMIGHKGFIAGGCFKNIFNNEHVKDLDFFFENKIDFLEAERYYEKHAEDGWYKYYSNDKVSVFKNKKKPEIAIELIKSVFGKPKDIISQFDFSITKFAYYKDYNTMENENGESEIVIDYMVIHHKSFFEHLHMKRLVTEADLTFPIGTFERMLRYAKYGYFPCKETKKNIIENIRTKTVAGDNLNKSLYHGFD